LFLSASYAGLQEWESAIKDAKECIRLNPEFIKGYYRLATAQLESKDYDAAEATIKQGLGLDSNHSQLLKLLRNTKLYKKAAAAASSSSVATTGANANRQLDTATTRELYDLQVQYSNTAREYNTVKANLNKAAREEKMYGITLSEVKENPSISGDYFRSVGKLFMRSSQTDIFKHLETNIQGQKKKQQELNGKSEWLEKRLKSQQMNMKELAGQ
jgi:chaperonin cofactor prefoldin